MGRVVYWLFAVHPSTSVHCPLCHERLLYSGAVSRLLRPLVSLWFQPVGGIGRKSEGRKGRKLGLRLPWWSRICLPVQGT